MRGPNLDVVETKLEAYMTKATKAARLSAEETVMACHAMQALFGIKVDSNKVLLTDDNLRTALEAAFFTGMNWGNENAP